MAGALTKMGIASVLFSLIFVIFVYAMVQLGNSYGVSVEEQYATQSYYEIQRNQTNQYQDLLEGASIDQQSQDTAQLQGKISAENSKVG